MVTSIDTNVISALWSKERSAGSISRWLNGARQEGALVICAPVLAELLAYPGATRDFVEGFLRDTGIQTDFALSEKAWLTAGAGFAAYAARRRAQRSGNPKRLLADFVVGAYALLNSDRLLTLDPDRYRVDFPTLRLPELDA